MSDTFESFESTFESISGYKRWKNWFIALSVITFLLFVGLFSSVTITLESLGGASVISIYLVIIVLSVATIYKTYQDAVFLEEETKLASVQVRQLNELNDVPSFLEAADKSIFRSHIGSLFTIFKVHSQIQQDNLVEILQLRLLARNRVAELFASILITLGLIGTILGLILMMSELKVVMNGQSGGDSDNLIASLMGEGGPLSGLDAAFYTTLLGALFGGVILRILTSVISSNISRYTAHLAELTEVYVLPMMRNTAAKLEESGYYKRS